MAVRLADLPTFRAPRNIVLDARTVAAMVRIFCRDVHGRPAGHLCKPCAALLEYAEQRLARCPFGPEKTTCRECPIHCYRPAQRSVMKDVMRYAGPRMLWRHPWLAVRHLWLDRKGPPPWPPYASRRRAAQGNLTRTSLSPFAGRGIALRGSVTTAMRIPVQLPDLATGRTRSNLKPRDRDAYLVARAPNPFASVCGCVCAAPCEDACRRGTIDAPISIRALKRYVAEQYGVESIRPDTRDALFETDTHEGNRYIGHLPLDTGRTAQARFSEIGVPRASRTSIAG